MSPVFCTSCSATVVRYGTKECAWLYIMQLHGGQVRRLVVHHAAPRWSGTELMSAPGCTSCSATVVRYYDNTVNDLV